MLIRSADDLLLGRPLSWWVKVRMVLELHQIADADQLAFKLMARAPKEERERIVRKLAEWGS